MTVVPGIGAHRTPLVCARCGRGETRTAGGDLRIEYHAGMVLVELGTDLDVRVADLFRRMVVAVGAGRSRVVLDLADVTRMDSAGLGALVRARREIARHGGTLCLAAPSAYLVALLRTMRFDLAFPVFADRRQALTSPPGAPG